LGKRRGYNHAIDNTDNKELRERLIRLGSPRLADALVYLSSRLDGAAEYVEALLLTLYKMLFQTSPLTGSSVTNRSPSR